MIRRENRCRGPESAKFSVNFPVGNLSWRPVRSGLHPPPRSRVLRVTTPISARTKSPRSTARGFKLNLSGLIDRRAAWTLQGPLSAAAGVAGNAARCVEGWSMIGKWTGRPVPDVLAAHRRGLDGEICRLRMRRRILLQHRHGLGAAPADLSHLQDFRRNPGAALRLSAQAAHSTKLGFKNPKWITAIFVTTASRGEFGKIADTIGSPECDGTSNSSQAFRKQKRTHLRLRARHACHKRMEALGHCPGAVPCRITQPCRGRAELDLVLCTYRASTRLITGSSPTSP